jgi:hypothetical protein
MLTNRESVRLASEEMGIRIPRAMQSVVSNCGPAMAAISALSTAMVGIGFISIGYMVFKELDELAEKWFNATAAVNAYIEKAGQAANEKLIDSSSIEIANAEYAKLIAHRDELLKQKAAAGIDAGSGLLDSATQFGAPGSTGMYPTFMPNHDMQRAVAPDPFLPENDKDLAATQEKIDKLSARKNELGHQSKVERINLENDAHQRALDLAKEKYDNTVKQHALDHDISQRAYDNAVEQGKTGSKLPHVVTVPNDDAKAQYAADIAAANKKTEVKSDSAAKEKQILAEVTRLEAQANEAGKKGVELMEAKREAALAQWTAKSAEGRRAIAAINKIYDEDESAYSQHENEERQKSVDAYVARAQGAADDAAIAATSGYERITMQAQKATDAAIAEYDKETKAFSFSKDQQAQRAAAQQQILTDIQTKADAERQQLHERGDAIVAGTAAAAESHGAHGRGGAGLAGMAQAHQQAMQQILAQELDKDNKLQAMRDKNELDDIQLAQAEVNTHREAMQEIAEKDEEMRQRIAGTLESAFRDPTKFIENAAQKMMFNMIADWVMQLDVFKRFFGSVMDGEPGGAGKSGGIMAHLMGGGNSGSAHGAGSPAGAPSAHAAGVSSSTGATVAGAGSAAQAGADYWGVGAGSGGSSGFAGVGAGNGFAISGGGSGNFTGGGGYVPTMASGGSYAPHSTSSVGSDIASTAQTGFADFKTLRSDYAHTQGAGAPKAAANAAQPGAGVPGGDESTAGWVMNDDGSVTHPADASAINSQSDVDDATKGLGGNSGSPWSNMSGGQQALAGAGAGLAAYSGGAAIWHDMATGGRSAGNQAKSIGGATLTGAMTGASIGMLFGPEGAVIGAAAGAAIGFVASGVADITGEAGKKAARKYFHDELDPAIQQEVTGFRTGGGDFQSAIAGINKTASDGMIKTQKDYGGMAASYLWNTYLNADVTKADSEIEKLAKAGSAGLKASASQYHDGGSITGFGSFATSSTEGFIHALMGETVMNRQASTSPLHAPALSAMNNGADAATMAAHYLSQVKPNGSAGNSGGDTHHHWDVSTLDSKSFRDMLKNGGAEVINGELNNFTGTYAGGGRL